MFVSAYLATALIFFVLAIYDLKKNRQFKKASDVIKFILIALLLYVVAFGQLPIFILGWVIYKTKKGYRIERLSDIVLFILVAVPLILFLLTAPFCNGWNEGSAHGTCSIPALEGIYDFICAAALGLAFSGGFLVVGIVVAISLITSLSIKIIRFSKNLKDKKHRLSTHTNKSYS